LKSPSLVDEVGPLIQWNHCSLWQSFIVSFQLFTILLCWLVMLWYRLYTCTFKGYTYLMDLAIPVTQKTELNHEIRRRPKIAGAYNCWFFIKYVIHYPIFPVRISVIFFKKVTLFEIDFYSCYILKNKSYNARTFESCSWYFI
jgi:hypothetical protein